MNSTHAPPNRLVIKIGGSLMQSDQLIHWLTKIQSIAQDQNTSILIVPGGGVFADQVRSSQSECGFDDQTAHELAMLAMGQFGRVLLQATQQHLNGDLPAFVPVHTQADIEQSISKKQLAIVCPESDLIQAITLPASWEVTSDSIAMWLARAFSAEACWLIKSCSPEKPHYTLKELSDLEVVDEYLPKLVSTDGPQIYWFGPLDWQTITLNSTGINSSAAIVTSNFAQHSSQIKKIL